MATNGLVDVTNVTNVLLMVTKFQPMLTKESSTASPQNIAMQWAGNTFNLNIQGIPNPLANIGSICYYQLTIGKPQEALLASLDYQIPSVLDANLPIESLSGSECPRLNMFTTQWTYRRYLSANLFIDAQ